MRAGTARRLGQDQPQGVAQPVAERGVEAKPFGRAGHRRGLVPIPVLGDLNRLGLGVAQRAREVPAETVAAVMVDHGDFVISDAVGSILLKKEPRVVD